MENNKKFNLQLFADESTGGVPPTDNGTQIDYESEYKKMLAERDSYKAEAEKQKGLKDKYASENAEYKKKEVEKMSDEEKKAKDYQELVEAKNKMEAEIRTMKLERDLLSNGFTAEECEKLIKANISISDISVLTNIIKEKVEVAVKSAKAEGIKNTTPSTPLGNGTANGSNESDFQKFQKSKQKQNNIVDL